MSEDNDLANKIKVLRNQKKWSQEALAEHADMSVSAIKKIETGERKDPGINTVTLIAKALGVTCNELSPISQFEMATDQKMVFYGAFLEKLGGLSPQARAFVLSFVFQDLKYFQESSDGKADPKVLAAFQIVSKALQS